MRAGTDWIVIEEVGARVRVSAPSDYVRLDRHMVPRVLELEDLPDAGDPLRYVRVEVTGETARLAELRLSSPDPDSDGIRQADLREIEVNGLVEGLVALFTLEVAEDGKVTSSLEDRVWHDAVRLVGRMRSGKTSRTITPQLLEKVATVYRDNIDRHPTKAVQHHFQVSQRMAAEYVSRARKRGLLPPTKRGKKNA